MVSFISLIHSSSFVVYAMAFWLFILSTIFSVNALDRAGRRVLLQYSFSLCTHLNFPIFPPKTYFPPRRILSCLYDIFPV